MFKDGEPRFRGWPALSPARGSNAKRREVAALPRFLLTLRL